MRITREQAQICSICSMCLGVALMIITPYLVPGVAMVGISVWIMMMSESVLLVKVENEMRNALEEFSRKKEKEVEEVLYFLRQSSISASPYESIEGAKKLCKKIDFPGMVVSNTHQIMIANEHMHRLLGWNPDAGELNGTPVYLINDPAVLSMLGGLAMKPDIQERKCMATYYVYVHKGGKKIRGQLVAHKIKNEGFFAVFYPEEKCLITYDEITEFLKK